VPAPSPTLGAQETENNTLMDITNPRRILVTELPNSGVLSLLRGKIQKFRPNRSKAQLPHPS